MPQRQKKVLREMCIVSQDGIEEKVFLNCLICSTVPPRYALSRCLPRNRDIYLKSFARAEPLIRRTEEEEEEEKEEW